MGQYDYKFGIWLRSPKVFACDRPKNGQCGEFWWSPCPGLLVDMMKNFAQCILNGVPLTTTHKSSNLASSNAVVFPRTWGGRRRDGVRRLREADPGQVPAARAGARVACGVRALRRLPRAPR